VGLEISDYSFNGGEEPGVREIGLISTSRNDDGNLQTDLKVGDTFKYHSGFTANHDISLAIDRVQESAVIPNIPRQQLEALPNYQLRKKAS